MNQNANQAVDQNQQYWLDKMQQNKLAGGQLKNDLGGDKNLKLDLNSDHLGGGLNANLNANNLNANLNSDQLGVGNLAGQNQAFQGNLNNNLPNANLNSPNIAAGLGNGLGNINGNINNLGQQNLLPNNIPVNPAQDQVNMQIALPGKIFC